MALTILADLSDISRHSRGYGSTNFVLILAGFIAIVLIVGLIITLLEKIRSSDSPADSQNNASLLQTLAQELGLTAEELLFIEQLAIQEQLPVAELLFVDPSLWKSNLDGEAEKREIARSAMSKIFGVETMQSQQLQESQPLTSV
ncbi:hypothetical protein [Rubinisphaera italica]|uniref:Uncharacterized protein n=1 Tax=Rubinisphaera italica TaxID=2527969 RepID=A0A5C5XGY2_9PLAN|nr:hypothetical protein [Rubinisphaera italica]TWT62084.1 hypothetical protein Pan54_28230 [Rubinisphaera italica]